MGFKNGRNRYIVKVRKDGELLINAYNNKQSKFSDNSDSGRRIIKKDKDGHYYQVREEK